MKYKRHDELNLALSEDSMGDFLDTINSIKELETVQNLAKNKFAGQFKNLQNYFYFFNFYKKNIEKYSNLTLTKNDFAHTPLVFEKIKDHPCGQIIYYRFLDFCTNPWRGGIDEIAEFILEKQKAGENMVVIDLKTENYLNFDKEILEIFTVYSQVQPNSLRKLFFPKLKWTSSDNKSFSFCFQ